ncbi:MAG: hypothetical protein JO308_06065, partial [Verrucomicrobia bacterium]|nr:hypothetical protein [Verrucomicrobiota bacterium]
MLALLRSLPRYVGAVVLGLAAVLATGCSTESGQIKTTDSTLVAAQKRLVQAERPTADKDTQAAEYLEIAAIALNDLPSKKATPEQLDKEPAVVLYDRAAADLAADLPTLIQQHPGANPIALLDRRTGQTDRLQLDSKQPDGYSPGDFYKIISGRDID